MFHKGSGGFCIQKSLVVNCKPLLYRCAASQLHPLWVMFKKLLADRSSAVADLLGHS